MTVHKFRSMEEMNRARSADSGLSDIERFLRQCARYWLIAPKVYPRGVFKFRTIEEAQQARRDCDLISARGADVVRCDADET